ncbi:DUF488 domain-containing protein [Isoptericola sp. NEAU-Y5]|uniref:DUF488 domain-containing protein n=1 Tax=Isoptericola luteus TaxID=2879484 RepID=A0ABS7ZNC5_9MICO|nr:DUF488 domain-containing protein [Isoptericola sp. NEAU-Y5]MCA5895149.1 DUF488 domain-containing protein [Isoptericola sp. NEAU-Y5]
MPDRTDPTPSEPFFTVGHSSRTLQEFVDLLRQSGVELLVDVRRLPGSARYPHFDEDALAASLRSVRVGFERAEGLTGRRPVSKDVPFEMNAWWENRSFHNYADHALSDDFRHALADLREQGHARRLAVMCSEAVWWRCHRRIIADHLLAHGEEVRHIVGRGHVDPARLSAGAVVGEGRRVTYPLPDDGA